MTVIKQPNGIYHVEFQFLGRRVHRSALTRSRQVALAYESQLRQKLIERGRLGVPQPPLQMSLEYTSTG
jgi:hypothetical protein